MERFATPAAAIICPQCGGSNTKRLNAGQMAGASFAGAGCMMWVPILGWIVAPVLFLSAVFFALAALVPSFKANFYCRACTRLFRVSKSAVS